MKEERYFYVPEAPNKQSLPDDEAVHAVRVLRLKAGDDIVLIDGEGSFYKATVTEATQKRCSYQIVEVMPQQRQWEGKVHLAIAPTKLMDRMEWLAEKATEVGIDELSFLDCQFSERHSVKLPRIEKIVVAATKQSRKAWLPEVNEIEDFMHFISHHATGRRFIAHCYEEVPRTSLFDELCKGESSEDTLVLIGPEGDFSIDEVHKAVEKGFISVHLGSSRLRTETAGLAAVMMMQLSK